MRLVTVKTHVVLYVHFLHNEICPLQGEENLLKFIRFREQKCYNIDRAPPQGYKNSKQMLGKRRLSNSLS